MRQFVSHHRLVLAVLMGVGGLLLLGRDSGRTADQAGVDEAAIARTREKVRMLDDLYKGFVVHITATYVKAQETTPAARVAKKVFKHRKTRGGAPAGSLTPPASRSIRPTTPRQRLKRQLSSS
jgi:hypothetical protein